MQRAKITGAMLLAAIALSGCYDYGGRHGSRPGHWGDHHRHHHHGGDHDHGGRHHHR